MNLFIAILSTLLGSLSNIFLKKALTYNISLLNYTFLGFITPFIIFLLYYLFIGDIKINLESKVIFIIFILFCFHVTGIYFFQKILKIEKITYLLPYTNLEKIFTIIFSFFLFKDVTNITFFIILFTIILVILFSIDYKNLKFPKNILIFGFSQLAFTISNIILGYILLEPQKGGLGISGFNFMIIYLFIGTLGYLILFLIFKWYSELKQINSGFYIYIGIGSFFGFFSWFLSIIIISNLGLSMSILLSFLGLTTTLFFTFLIFKDIPTKKDVILTFLVIILISIGYYFK